MNPFDVEELTEPCPVCDVAGRLVIYPQAVRLVCEACGECVHIIIDAGQG